MANIKVNGKTVKAKQRVVRNPLFADEKYVGTEPVWDTARALLLPENEFDSLMRTSLNYYNYFYNQKDVKKHLIAWLKTQETYSAADVKTIDRISDKAVPMTVCSLIKAHTQGMPLLERHLLFIENKLRKVIADAAPEIIEKVATAKLLPTIQDRIAEKTAETLGELEYHFDNISAGAANFNAYDFLTINKVPQLQLTKYQQIINEKREEINLAYTKADKQLVEGYNHYKVADFRRILGWLDAFLTSIEQYKVVKQTTRKIRAPRALSKEKVVAKLKYCVDDKVLKIVSINPTDIIGAQILWCYNVKTRKIIMYTADPIEGPLNVKGTSLTGFDTVKSVSKTLRKPAEQLLEFAKTGKVGLRKFMDNVKTTATIPNGRMSADIVLLKVQL